MDRRPPPADGVVAVGATASSSTSTSTFARRSNIDAVRRQLGIEVDNYHTKDRNDDDDDDGDNNDEVVVERTANVFEVVHQRVQQADRDGKIIMIDHHDEVVGQRQDKKSQLLPPPPPPPSPSAHDDIIGRRVCKQFGTDWFYGSVSNTVEVVDFDVDGDDDDEGKHFHVDYDDGDSEDLSYSELMPCLEEWSKKHRRSKDIVWKQIQRHVKRSEQKNKNKKRKPAPSTSTSTSPNGKKLKQPTLDDLAASTSKSSPGSPVVVRVKKEKSSTEAARDSRSKLYRSGGGGGGAANATTANDSTVVTPPRGGSGGGAQKAASQRTPPPRFDAEEWINQNNYDFDVFQGWICEMAQWLEREQLSKPNGRMILRQVMKLASGQGVGYKHWPSRVIFLENVQIDLDYDFEYLGLFASRYEQKFGEDKGHGWLLRHPIKKLQLFQEFQGMQPTTDVLDHPMFVSHI